MTFHVMKSSHCNLCGQSLDGLVFTYASSRHPTQRPLVICAECNAHAARCRLCQRPMAERLAQEGICAFCLLELERCASCGRPVDDGIELKDGTHRVFCHTCVQTLPACLACQAPVDARGSRLPDGRVRCRFCDVTAVDDPAQAQALYEQVLKIAAQRLGLELSIPTVLVPVDADQLRAVLQQIEGVHQTEARPPRGVYARKGMKRGIYVEMGLPRVQMIEVIAHELGHAWQAERKPLLNDPLLVEGFAEWVAYKVLAVLGASTAMDLMRARTDVYGQGLRRVLAWQTDDPMTILERSR